MKYVDMVKIAVVSGMIFTNPIGVVFWDYIQSVFDLKNSVMTFN